MGGFHVVIFLTFCLVLIFVSRFSIQSDMINLQNIHQGSIHVDFSFQLRDIIIKTLS
jgi:hypothetical protein